MVMFNTGTMYAVSCFLFKSDSP